MLSRRKGKVSVLIKSRPGPLGCNEFLGAYIYMICGQRDRYMAGLARRTGGNDVIRASPLTIQSMCARVGDSPIMSIDAPRASSM